MTVQHHLEPVRLHHLPHLPVEILHIVLLYLSSDFRDLILFASLCKEWKEAADHSLVWLSCDLRFSCPLSYYELQLDRYSTRNDLNLLTDRSVITVRLDQKLHHNLNTRYNVIVDRVDCFEVPALTNDNKSVEEMQAMLPHLPQLQAKITRDLFMAKFVQWHRLWHWYVRWQPVAKRIEDRIDGVLQGWYGAMSVVVSVVCHVIACYMFWDMKNVVGEKDKKGGESFRLGVREHIGFGLLYMYLLVNGLLLMMLSVRRVANQVVKPRSTDLSCHFEYAELYPPVSALILVFGSLSSLLLLHVKLSLLQIHLTTFPYVIIPIPLSVSILCPIILMKRWMKRYYQQVQFLGIGLYLSFVVTTAVCVLTTLITLAKFYDNTNDHVHALSANGPIPLFLASTIFTTMCIYLFIDTLIGVLDVSLLDNQVMCFNRIYKSHLIVFGMVIRFIFALGLLGILIYLDAHMTSFLYISISFAKGIFVCILFSLFTYIEVLLALFLFYIRKEN